ncbi:CHAP domain-containing protein [Nocardia speluncae]|uniref:CHAP domain-containing protein n=1 Tax=Nocardia speluncae TaxID=419477 RepID=UPI001FE204C3|nr:CHAP domain-containing protein [Nocardia speluncae]
MTTDIGYGRARPAGRAIGALCVLVSVLAVLGGCALPGSGAGIVGERLTEFPVIDRSMLTPAQARVVDAAAAEFAAPRSGPEYSEGTTEPWCANFVSWVMRAAGLPLVNPNSGSWRIPGVYTLQEYYESRGRFVSFDPAYRPVSGEVVLYSPDSRFGQHTNIVIDSENGVLTTIGGNENDEVSIEQWDPAGVGDIAIVGYGRL